MRIVSLSIGWWQENFAKSLGLILTRPRAEENLKPEATNVSQCYPSKNWLMKFLS